MRYHKTMILPQAPIIEPVNPTVVNEIQAAEMLYRTDVQQIIKEAILKHMVKRAIKENEHQGVATSVTIMDVASGRTIYGHDQNTEHFAASINKIPIALLVLKDIRAGTLNLDQIMTWQESDRRGGFGVYDQPDSPLQASLREVLHDLLNRSGNTAVRVVVNGALGGAAAVNARWEATPQLSHTYLIPLDANRFFLGNSTTHDSLWAMDQLMKNQDAPAMFMKDALATNIFSDFGTRSQLAGNDYIVLVNKIGLLDDVEGNNRHDVGLIYNTKSKKAYGYAFFTTSPFESPTATVRADQSLMDMGRYMLRFAGDKKVHVADPESLNVQNQPVSEGRILY